jgi:hypothetical protein
VSVEAENTEMFANVMFDYFRQNSSSERDAVIKSAISTGIRFEDWYSRLDFSGLEKLDEAFRKHGVKREDVYRRLFDLQKAAVTD